jgi:hypothetical protein
MVERPMGDDGTPSRRINLRTADGTAVPLTIGYRPDSDGAILKIADQIRAVLGREAEHSQAADVEALIAAGKTLEAIKLVRETEGLSLTEAKQRVDEMSRAIDAGSTPPR